MEEKNIKIWKNLKRGDRVWINGKTGEIGEVKKIWVDESLEEVRIETWVHTSKLLIRRYHGPTIIFYRQGTDKRAYSDYDAIGLIDGEIYEGNEEIITQDNMKIISLTEQEGKEAEKKILEKERQSKIVLLSSTIEGLEKDIKEKENLILNLRGELKEILRQKDEET